MAKKILIADDEQMIRDAVRLSLQDEGYDIYEAKDGYEALDKAQHLIPDLVILDVMMPGMIGYKVCKEIKNDPSTKDIIVMFLTARESGMASEAMLESGGDGLLGKPFMPADLRNKIREMLEK